MYSRGKFKVEAHYKNLMHVHVCLTGLSIIQDGKIPYYLNDDKWKTVFGEGLLQGCLQQLRLGFQKVGIYQVL